MTKTDLKRLDALAEWMRATGATRVVLTSARVEVDLGPVPVVVPAYVAPTHEELEAADRAAKAEIDRLTFMASEGG